MIENLLLLPLFALAAFVTGWVIAVATFRTHPCGLPPRLRWRWHIVVCLIPFALGVGMLPFPANVGMTFCLGATVLWWRARRNLLDGTARLRTKSIDVGTGIRVITERPGPVPEGLRDEIEIWQRAAGRTLSGVPAPEKLC